MGNHVVDTNVLLSASSGHETSPFCDTTHLTKKQLRQVLDWLVEFHADPTRQFALDHHWLILDEYFRHLKQGDIAHLVLRDKLQFAQFFQITVDPNGHAILPDALAALIHDKDDRKFVAVALSDPTRPAIVNACDDDWATWESGLATHGVSVLQLV